MSGEISVGERLALIAGDIRLVLEKQTRYDRDVENVTNRLNTHSNRITILEAKEHQRTGAALFAKVLIGIACAVIGASGAILTKGL